MGCRGAGLKPRLDYGRRKVGEKQRRNPDSTRDAAADRPYPAMAHASPTLTRPACSLLTSWTGLKRKGGPKDTTNGRVNAAKEGWELKQHE